VFGKTLLTEHLSKQLPAQIGAGLTIAYREEESRMKLFTDGMRFDRERSAASERAVGLEVPPNYIYWVLVFRGDVLPRGDHKLLSMSSLESVKKSLQLTEGWHHSLLSLLRRQTSVKSGLLSRKRLWVASL
jgi:hypothetical protein